MSGDEESVEQLRVEFRLPTWAGPPGMGGESPVIIAGVTLRDLSTEGGRLGDFALEYEGRNSLETTHAVITALLLSSDANIKQSSSVIRRGKTERRETQLESDYTSVWGHLSGQIPPEAIDFASRHADAVLEQQNSKSFTRIGIATDGRSK